MTHKLNRTLALAALLAAACGAQAEDLEATTEVSSQGEALNFALPHTMHNKANMNECMGVAAGKMDNLTPIITWTCDGSLNQTWYESPDHVGSTHFQLRNGANCNKCLGFPTSGARIQDCNWDDGGQWFTKDDAGHWGPGCFFFASEYPLNQPWLGREVLGVVGGVVADGKTVDHWTRYDGHYDQVWCPQP